MLEYRRTVLMKQLTAVILAAGEGKRMKSKNAKCSHKVCGKPMVEWVLRAVEGAGADETILVVGHRADQIKTILGDRVKYAVQEKQLGTGHAVMQAEVHLKNSDGCVLVLCGDTPLITRKTLVDAVDYHNNSGCAATVITAKVDDPSGYGRILRGSDGQVLKIVEHRDATSEQRAINEINSGMYIFDTKMLFESLKEVNNKNDQGEYYLTDTLEILINRGSRVGAFVMEDPGEILGINDRRQLSEASSIMNRRILNDVMSSGVTIIDPASTYIDADCQIGIDTVIYPDTIIEGKTVIGDDAIIGPNSRLVNSIVGDGSEIAGSVVLDSKIGSNVHLGPFAYVRPGSSIGDNVKIGDFVEIKNSFIGANTKIPHLTYVGDSEVGEKVNVACGVVTVNYDGKKKHKTIIGDGAFVGCNVNLVSPVKVGDNAYIAAGSTITEDVPEDALAIAREKQTVKEGWVEKKGLRRK